MDFALSKDLTDYLAELDAFIDSDIKPLEKQDDNIRFFGRTPPDTCATPGPRTWAARAARTSTWR